MGNTESGQACWISSLMFPAGSCNLCKNNSLSPHGLLDGFGNTVDMTYFNAKNGSVILKEISGMCNGTIKIEISNDVIKM